jgi:hypothetical protein
MTPEEIWNNKSDEALLTAGAVLSEYTDHGQRIIQTELQRRGLTVPIVGPIVETPTRGVSGHVPHADDGPAFAQSRLKGASWTIVVFCFQSQNYKVEPIRVGRLARCSPSRIESGRS